MGTQKYFILCVESIRNFTNYAFLNLLIFERYIWHSPQKSEYMLSIAPCICSVFFFFFFFCCCFLFFFSMRNTYTKSFEHSKKLSGKATLNFKVASLSSQEKCPSFAWERSFLYCIISSRLFNSFKWQLLCHHYCLTLHTAQTLPSAPFTCYQGPVVQSIISLTSSLRGQLVKCFMTL